MSQDINLEKPILSHGGDWLTFQVMNNLSLPPSLSEKKMGRHASNPIKDQSLLKFEVLSYSAPHTHMGNNQPSLSHPKETEGGKLMQLLQLLYFL